MCICILLLVFLVPVDVRGIGASGTGVTDDCELPCGFWELNLGYLGEQLMLLTPGPFLQFNFGISQIQFKMKEVILT